MRALIFLILLLTVVPILELVLILQAHHAIASAWGSGVALLLTTLLLANHRVFSSRAVYALV